VFPRIRWAGAETQLATFSLARQAFFPAQLLGGQMPREIREVFRKPAHRRCPLGKT